MNNQDELIDFIKSQFSPNPNWYGYCLVCGKKVLMKNMEEHLKSHDDGDN